MVMPFLYGNHGYGNAVFPTRYQTSDWEQITNYQLQIVSVKGIQGAEVTFTVIINTEFVIALSTDRATEKKLIKLSTYTLSKLASYCDRSNSRYSPSIALIRSLPSYTSSLS